MLLADIINNSDEFYSGNLRHYFKCLFSARGANNPFHNIRHSLDVLIKCYDGLLFYKDRIIDKSARRALLVAAIFHDFGHTGRSGNDDVNIILALRGFDKHILPEDAGIREMVLSLIGSTEYGPAGHVKLNNTLLSQILKDADLSQVCSQAWIRLVIFGLAEEMQTTPESILRMQESFLSKTKFYTDWARQKFDLNEKIEEARQLIEILDS